jgi:mRNA-degrading endonuclease RelE of RelBE toxin-antitoxin system
MDTEWSVELTSEAEAQLASLPDPIRSEALREIEGLGDEPLPPGSKQLRSGKTYSIRLHDGSYRIVYRVSKTRILITRVRHRDSAYHGL